MWPLVSIPNGKGALDMAHITIPAQEATVAYVAASGQAVFPVPYPFFSPADIVVYRDGVLVGSGYTVAGTGGTDGGFPSGSVTFSAPQVAGAKITLDRQIMPERVTDFPYPSRTLDIRALNTEQDREMAILQDHRRKLNRALVVPRDEPGLMIPSAIQRAGRVLGFDQAGAAVALPFFNGSAPPGTVSPVSFGLSTAASAAVNTAAILAALALSSNVFLPPGVFQVLRGQILVGSAQAFRGAGRYVSRLVGAGGTGATVGYKPSSTGPIVSDMWLDSIGTPGQDDHGFDASPSAAQATLERVGFSHNRHGAIFANTDFSTCRDLIAEYNLGYGFWERALAGTLALQWYWVGNNLAQYNGSDGWRVENTVAGPAGLPVGTMDGIYSFSNGGRSITVQGVSGHALHGFRLGKHFLGDDQAGLFFDTFGNHHQVAGGFAELMTAGPGYGATANNYGIRITDCGTQQNAFEGVISEAPGTDVLNCHHFSNGRAGDVSRAAGVRLRGQGSSVVGGRSGNLPGSTSQRYGVEIDAANCTVSSINLNDNAVAPLNPVSGAGSLLMAAVHPHDGLFQRLGRLQSSTVSPSEFEAGAVNSGGSGKRAVVVPN
jgi:hypothetical protein